ncbi:MAG: nucleotidyltransferase domain-containing protein [bacterium]
MSDLAYHRSMEHPDPISAKVPAGIQEPFRTVLVAAGDEWISYLRDDLVSLVLFGSVARGCATQLSDIDLLVVAHGLPRSLADRRRPLLDRLRHLREERDLPSVPWNLLVKTPEEARHHSPIYLDIVEDGVLLHDRGQFFAGVLAAMRSRMQALGSRRIFLEDGSWYWDLKPDFRFGEVVEI